ncbi:MAG: GNAT family N-acetyltransferase [Flavobacteriales bacterium]|nr:GNAT family N-acetyltransferase [Flavobacteriales bacterium]
MITLTRITDPGKLEEYFRFRYRIYSESRLKGFLPEGNGTDKDAFDERADHYGWYMHDELVGCVRFVQPDAHEIAIPMLGYMKDSTAIAVHSYINSRRSKDQSMVERAGSA